MRDFWLVASRASLFVGLSEVPLVVLVVSMLGLSLLFSPRAGLPSARSETLCGPPPPAPSEPPVAGGPVPRMAEGQGGSARREGPHAVGGDLDARTASACAQRAHPQATGGSDGAGGGGGFPPSCSVGGPRASQGLDHLLVDDPIRVQRPCRHNVRLTEEEERVLEWVASRMGWPPSKVANRLLGGLLRSQGIKP